MGTLGKTLQKCPSCTQSWDAASFSVHVSEHPETTALARLSHRVKELYLPHWQRLIGKDPDARKSEGKRRE